MVFLIRNVFLLVALVCGCCGFELFVCLSVLLVVRCDFISYYCLLVSGV